MYPQLREILGTELHDGDRLVHAADDGALFLKDLHQHMGMLLIRTEDVDRPIEVDVAVIAFADPFHREPEDGRVQSLPPADRRLAYRATRHRLMLRGRADPPVSLIAVLQQAIDRDRFQRGQMAPARRRCPPRPAPVSGSGPGPAPAPPGSPRLPRRCRAPLPRRPEMLPRCRRRR